MDTSFLIVDEDEFQWEERPTCWISHHEQKSEEWFNTRKCAITMSKISAICGRSKFYDSGDKPKLARVICGLEKDDAVTNKMSQEAINLGIKGEPIIRDWLSSELKRDIKEVGVAVWKEDERFRASLDGEFPDDPEDFIEIKIPKKMYRPLIECVEGFKKGINNKNPNSHSHIFDSHYDQIIGSGIITGKKRCLYTVASAEDCNVFTQWLYIDRDHWDTFIYPAACNFYNGYIKSLMECNNLKRIVPKGMLTNK